MFEITLSHCGTDHPIRSFAQFMSCSRFCYTVHWGDSNSELAGQVNLFPVLAGIQVTYPSFRKMIQEIESTLVDIGLSPDHVRYVVHLSCEHCDQTKRNTYSSTVIREHARLFRREKAN